MKLTVLYQIVAAALTVWIGSLPSVAVGQERYANVVDAIFSAWKTVDVVCLGEIHGSQHDTDLRIALVRHPAFADAIRVIAVEFAASTQQALLDRYILDNQAMSREQLAPVWRDAGAALNWESPVYERFFRAVQGVNARLPRDRRVRVIAGDRATDWSSRKSPQEDSGRTPHMRSLVAEHVLKPGVKGLAIYGASHCDRRRGFLGQLASDYPERRIWLVEPVTGSDRRRRAREVLGLGGAPAYAVVTGAQWASVPAADLLFVPPGVRAIGDAVDAVVYHGDVPDVTVPADLVGGDDQWRREWQRRLAIMAPMLSRLPDEARKNARSLWGLSP